MYFYLKNRFVIINLDFILNKRQFFIVKHYFRQRVFENCNILISMSGIKDTIFCS